MSASIFLFSISLKSFFNLFLLDSISIKFCSISLFFNLAPSNSEIVSSNSSVLAFIFFSTESVVTSCVFISFCTSYFLSVFSSIIFFLFSISNCLSDNFAVNLFNSSSFSFNSFSNFSLLLNKFSFLAIFCFFSSSNSTILSFISAISVSYLLLFSFYLPYFLFQQNQQNHTHLSLLNLTIPITISIFFIITISSLH